MKLPIFRRGYRRNIKFRACNANCASGFREDRRYGVIYPVAGTGYKDREAYSIGENVCAYCDHYPDETLRIPVINSARLSVWS